MKISPLFWPALVGLSTLSWTLAVQGQEQTAAPDAKTPDTKTPDAKIPGAETPISRLPDAFTPIAKAILDGDLAGAATALKAMQTAGLRPDQVSRWQTLAARVAIRQGDTQWLQQINEDGALSTGADELVTLTAFRLMSANRLDETRSTLAGIKKPYEMSEIPRRRYEELNLKLEQLSGDKRAEEKWAGQLVEFVSGWEGANCQSCHANPRLYGQEVTQFDLQSWWVGQRYSQLIKESGSALQIEKTARAALVKDSKDEAATIRLSYALRAQGKADEAEKVLRQIPWSQWSDRPFKKPLRLAQFP